ncbi:DUF2721 domain-containing protein [Maritalea myrionectae]|uniref:DUF2721 domain-containing protein n=1 Tax=Maritalea myrionectae TaxID=454601 RepID=UPI0004216AD8|nr:DUF2721 domain-containing protein [Maritalea myrionectae]
MDTIILTSTIAEEIQLSIAPVFLLTAIAGFLNVLGAHLSRAVDQLTLDEGSAAGSARDVRRIHYIIWSSRLSVMTAILVCLVVILIFLGDHVEPDLTGFISFSFVAAMSLLTVALILFLMQLTVARERALIIAKAGKRDVKK